MMRNLYGLYLDATARMCALLAAMTMSCMLAFPMHRDARWQAEVNRMAAYEVFRRGLPR